MIARYAPSIIDNINLRGLGLLGLVRTLERNLRSQKLGEVSVKSQLCTCKRCQPKIEEAVEGWRQGANYQEERPPEQARNG